MSYVLSSKAPLGPLWVSTGTQIKQQRGVNVWKQYNAAFHHSSDSDNLNILHSGQASLHYQACIQIDTGTMLPDSAPPTPPAKYLPVIAAFLPKWKDLMIIFSGKPSCKLISLLKANQSPFIYAKALIKTLIGGHLYIPIKYTTANYHESGYLPFWNSRTAWRIWPDLIAWKSWNSCTILFVGGTHLYIT